MQHREELSDALRKVAAGQGITSLGIAPAVTPAGYHRLLDWLSRGYHGEMHWMERRRSTSKHPNSMLNGTRSVIMAAVNYHTPPPQTTAGRMSAYVRGTEDYHTVLKRRLQPLARLIQEAMPEEKTRIVVDSAPLLERDFGQLAGIGWTGRNTMLISREFGSWFFLAAILTTAELSYDEPEHQNFCGTCTRCLDACPTDAFPEPYVLDARRCISYFNIELRDRMVPAEFRSGIGDWLFGCDICQEVCPWNRFAVPTEISEFAAPSSAALFDARTILQMSDEEFTRSFQGTPMQRTGAEVLRRNAALVLGNIRDHAAAAELTNGLRDSFPQVRMACAWSLCQFGKPEGLEAVRTAIAAEASEDVRADMIRSLEEAPYGSAPA